MQKRISSRDECQEIAAAGGIEVVIKPPCCRQFVRLVFALASVLLHLLASLSLLGKTQPVPDMDFYDASYPSQNWKYNNLWLSAVVFLYIFDRQHSDVDTLVCPFCFCHSLMKLQ